MTVEVVCELWPRSLRCGWDGRAGDAAGGQPPQAGGAWSGAECTWVWEQLGSLFGCSPVLTRMKYLL